MLSGLAWLLPMLWTLPALPPAPLELASTEVAALARLLFCAVSKETRPSSFCSSCAVRDSVDDDVRFVADDDGVVAAFRRTGIDGRQSFFSR